MKGMPSTKGMPLVPAKTSGHQVHAVMRTAGHPSNVSVRHPALPGPQMFAPSADHAELPSGSISKNTPAGGITGGIGPSQTERGAVQNEFVG